MWHKVRYKLVKGHVLVGYMELSLPLEASTNVLARELSRKGITLAAVQESGLAKQGDIHIRQGYRPLYSGGEKAGQKGFGIAISSEAYKALIAWDIIIR